MKIKAKVNDDRESVNAKDVLDEKFAIKALKVDETLEPAPNFVDTLDPVPQYKFGQASSGQKYNVPRLLDRFWMDLEHNEEVTSFAKLCCHGSEDLLSCLSFYKFMTVRSCLRRAQALFQVRFSEQISSA